VKKYPPVSFYPAPNANPERVVAVEQIGGLYEVTTEHQGTRCIYHRCRAGYAVGDEVTAPIRSHRKTIIPKRWSPFDGQEDD
jgi:hypothetical protein